MLVSRCFASLTLAQVTVLRRATARSAWDEDPEASLRTTDASQWTSPYASTPAMRSFHAADSRLLTPRWGAQLVAYIIIAYSVDVRSSPRPLTWHTPRSTLLARNQSYHLRCVATPALRYFRSYRRTAPSAHYVRFATSSRWYHEGGGERRAMLYRRGYNRNAATYRS